VVPKSIPKTFAIKLKNSFLLKSPRRVQDPHRQTNPNGI
jgi:hypothetical protein